MLYIHLGEFKNEYIIDVDLQFNIFKEISWFEDNFVKNVIREIDKSEVVKGEYIESPVWGGMSPEKLSSGCKAVILMKFYPQRVIYATRCGDNCVRSILSLAQQQDVHILLHHCMKFPDSFQAIMYDSGKEVTSDAEFVREYYNFADRFQKV